MKMNPIKTIALLIIFSMNAYAQPLAELENYKKQYPKSNGVFLKNNEVVTITLSKGQPEIIDNSSEELLLFNENAHYYDQKTIYFSDFNEILSVRAKTMVLNNDKYSALEPSEISTKKSDDRSIFYDDAQEKKILFSGLQAGSKILLDYTINVKNPYLLPIFFFNSYLPTLSSTYTLNFPVNMNIKYLIMNDNGKIEFTKTTKGKINQYQWTLKNANEYPREDDAPNARYYLPHIIVYIADYTIKGKKTSVLNGVDDLYKWYYGFIKNTNTGDSEGLKQVADSLKQISTTEIDLVKNVFYWVEDHVKYIAFEDGLEGFIPRQGSLVCDRRYGDCKDMASVIHALLKQAGVKSYLTWIGTRDIPYTFEQVPTAQSCNHMITTYIDKNGQYYFLDATAGFMPFGYPSSGIQGKEALLAIDSLNYKIVKVPEVSAELNNKYDTVRMTVSPDGLLKGTATYSVIGYYRYYTTGPFIYGNKQDFNKYVSSVTGMGNNKFKVDSFKLINLADLDKPFRIQYSFTQPDYASKTADEIFVNMNLGKLFYNELIDTSITKEGIERNNNYYEDQTYELQIPNGYKAEYIPADSKYENSLFGYSISYRQTGNTIVLHKRISNLFYILPPAHFAEWNAMIKSLNKSYNDSVILKKS